MQLPIILLVVPILHASMHIILATHYIGNNIRNTVIVLVPAQGVAALEKLLWIQFFQEIHGNPIPTASIFGTFSRITNRRQRGHHFYHILIRPSSTSDPSNRVRFDEAWWSNVAKNFSGQKLVALWGPGSANSFRLQMGCFFSFFRGLFHGEPLKLLEEFKLNLLNLKIDEFVEFDEFLVFLWRDRSWKTEQRMWNIILGSWIANCSLQRNFGTGTNVLQTCGGELFRKPLCPELGRCVKRKTG